MSDCLDSSARIIFLRAHSENLSEHGMNLLFGHYFSCSDEVVNLTYYCAC